MEYQMKFDTHSHALLTRRSAFDLAYFREFVARAADSGIGGLALTEHFNGPVWYQMMKTIDGEFPTKGDHWQIEGIRVFPGMEVDVAEHAHILCFGRLADLLEVRRGLDSHTEEGAFISTSSLLDLTEGREVVVVGAHPFRPSRNMAEIPDDLIRRFDALDLNAKDLVRIDRDIEGRTLEMASRLQLAVLAGGDSHHFFQLGSIWTEFPRAIDTVDEMRQALAARSGRIGMSSAIDLKVEAGQTVKRLLKHIDLLEGRPAAV
jgi:hypothetical protein